MATSGMRGRRATRARPLLLVVLAVGSLVAGIWGGLLRLAWQWPVVSAWLITFHGPLMVGGFVGTLIGLERAVAVDRPWSAAGPLASGLGGAALIFGWTTAGQWLLVLGSLVLVANAALILGRRAAPGTAVMGLGAVAWLAGNVLWALGWPIRTVTAPWMGFLVLTIAGERLELGRLMPRNRLQRAVFNGAIGSLVAGIALSVPWPGPGLALLGAGLLALAAWLGAFDVARRTIRQPGLPRFAAVCVLSGYSWLGAAGAVMLLDALAILPPGPVDGTAARVLGAAWDSTGVVPVPRVVLEGLLYDGVLHSLFLGFAFSMIFGHAPIVLPAISGLEVAYRNRLYLPLALLHASVAWRFVAALAASGRGRRGSGVVAAMAVLLFTLGMASSVRQALHRRASPRGSRKPRRNRGRGADRRGRERERGKSRGGPRAPAAGRAVSDDPASRGRRGQAAQRREAHGRLFWAWLLTFPILFIETATRILGAAWPGPLLRDVALVALAFPVIFVVGDRTFRGPARRAPDLAVGGLAALGWACGVLASFTRLPNAAGIGAVLVAIWLTIRTLSPPSPSRG